MAQPPTKTAIAFAVGTLGIAFFSAMDAVMKGLSLSIGTYNALLWRTTAGALIAAAFFFGARSPWPGKAAMRVHLTRGLIGVPMALTFFWGLARVPMAQAIALAFVAPLIALYLAALLLGEKIERRSLLASLLGFAGVLVIFWGQREAELGPDAFRGSLSILCSAGLYGYNIILMRRQALLAKPTEVAFFTSGIMAGSFLLAAPLLADLPPPQEAPEIVGAALLAFSSLLLLSWAYARAEAQHLAPVEYTSFVWAALLGWLIFAEPVQPFTLAGATMIVVACLIAATRRAPPDPDVDSGVHA
ncbi:MAG: S-adenosylmethionine uptake transporter [Sphingomonadales bacterium]|jgi:S-adenosylmethionine uptake transporter|nr:S-adenosylmethionine uptake transporter [Sphingomonadales bacterium]